MLLRRQKQYTRVGVDISTIIPDDIFLKLLNRKLLTKDDKLLAEKNMLQFSKTIKNISKDYNSIYIFACGDFGENNKNQKRILEKLLNKFNIDCRRIVICPNELIEATREFRVDVLVTNKYYKGKEKVLDITDNLALRRKRARVLKQGEYNMNYTNFETSSELLIDYIPDYTQLIYILPVGDKNKSDIKRIQFINDYYWLSNALDIAKKNIEQRKIDIFMSYEYIPKTGNPAFDRDDKAYWLASKFEENEYDKVLQNMSRFEFVMFHNRYNMDDPAYFYEPFNAKYTYNDIKKMVLSAMDYFVNTLHLKKGDTVAICLPNTIQDIVSQFALGHMGVKITPIHPLSSLNKLEMFIGKTKAKYFIYMDMPKGEDQNEPISLDYLIQKYKLNGVINVSLVEDANFIVKNLYNAKTKIETSRDVNSRRYILDDKSKMVNWSDLMKEAKNKSLKLEPSNLDTNDTSYYYSTGGTSAKRSKIVQLPHFFDNISYYNSYGINMEKGDVAFSNYPGYIAFSDGNCRHQPASVGLFTVVSPKDYPENFAKKLESTKASVLQVAPQFFRLMLESEERGEFDNIDLSHFKYVVAGGDKSSNELKEEVLAFFARHNNSNVHFFVGCGCTELGGSTIVQLFELGNTLDEKSIGIPLPVFKLRILDDNGNQLKNGEKQGELLIGIDNIDNIGYVDEDELTNKVLKKEGNTIWYNTEDVIEFSNEQKGVLNFISRNKRFVMITKDNTSGKIVPDDVELQIMENVKEVEIVSVVGVDENNETKLKAAVKLRNNTKVTDELTDRIKAAACKKDILAQLDEIVFIDTMPLTDRQKVKYTEIEDMFKNR